jgi:hypothetical protein
MVTSSYTTHRIGMPVARDWCKHVEVCLILPTVAKTCSFMAFAVRGGCILGCPAMTYDTFLAIMGCGLTAAGLVHSGWLWLGHSRPSFASLLGGGPALSTAFRVVAVMLAAPLILAGAAARLMDNGWRYVTGMLAGFVLSCAWCFMNGIVLVVSLGFLTT